MTFSLHKLVGLPAIAAAAFFMQALDATILNTALPDVARSLDRSPLAMQLAVVGYTLTVAMLIPVSGWLADRFGTRRVFISAVNFFILGSLLCALSTSLPMLVASRVLQGIGGAMMMPVARLAVLRAYPRTELVAVLNFISIPGLVGPVVGPLLGGWLVTYATWHWIFLINIPIGLIGILYAYHIMPDFTAPRRPFDWMGFFLFGLSLVSFSSGLEVFGDRVGPDFLPPVLLISGIALLGLYIRHARRHPSPLIRLSVFRTRTFSVGIGGNILSRLGTGCVPFLMPLMLQVGLGYPALVAGAMMAPTAIGSITAKTFAMKILNRFGYRVTLTGVTVCIGLMIAQFALQTPTLPLWMLILPLFMLGMAMSTQFTAMNSITLGDLSTEDASTGNGLLSVTQQLSISFGVASSTVVLRFYNSFASGTLLDHFHYTFITIGGITMMTACFPDARSPSSRRQAVPPRATPSHPRGTESRRDKTRTVLADQPVSRGVQRRRVCRGPEPNPAYIIGRKKKAPPSVHGERLQQGVGGNGYSVSAYSSTVCLTRARSPFRASMSDSCIMHAGHPVATTSAPVATMLSRFF